MFDSISNALDLYYENKVFKNKPDNRDIRGDGYQTPDKSVQDHIDSKRMEDDDDDVTLEDLIDGEDASEDDVNIDDILDDDDADDLLTDDSDEDSDDDLDMLSDDDDDDF